MYLQIEFKSRQSCTKFVKFIKKAMPEYVESKAEKESGHLKKYIGNLKYSEIKGASPVKESDIPEIDDMPF